tara:strand:- start:70 stop:645 length:576 start_codon:yes stop_codon:yes gene_type:complete
MKPVFIKNLLTPKEVFWIYTKVTTLPVWTLNTLTYYKQEDEDRHHGTIANTVITKDYQPTPTSAGLSMYGQSLVYRINERLKEQKKEIPTAIERFWINATFKSSSSHWPHWDSPNPEAFSILLFLAPVWSDQWLGSFFVDGEEFKFTPGGAVIFQSTEMHAGDNPSLHCPYIRLTANIVTNITNEGKRREI